MIRRFIFLTLILTVASAVLPKRKVTFRHHDIANPLAGEGWGTGGFTLNDFDRDGDLDITIQRRSNESVYWYEFKNDSTWIQHDVGRLGGGQLGAAAGDIDGDNFPDLVMGPVLRSR